MKPILAFDVYGTLVDPMGMAELLAPDAGEAAESVSAQFRGLYAAGAKVCDGQPWVELKWRAGR